MTDRNRPRCDIRGTSFDAGNRSSKFLVAIARFSKLWLTCIRVCSNQVRRADQAFSAWRGEKRCGSTETCELVNGRPFANAVQDIAAFVTEAHHQWFTVRRSRRRPRGRLEDNSPRCDIALFEPMGAIHLCWHCCSDSKHES